MEVPWNSEVMIIPTSVIHTLILSVVFFFSLLAILGFHSLCLILESLKEISLTEKEERESEKEEELERISSGENQVEQTEVAITEETYPPSPEEEPRPVILKGTTVTTKQYIGMLYTLMENISKRENVNKDVPLFNVEIPLHKILSYLDPESFTATAATCRYLRDVCHKSKQIKVSMENCDLHVSTSRYREPEITFEYYDQRLYSEFVKRIKRLPFVFSFNISVKGNALGLKEWDAIRDFLAGCRNFEVVELKSEAYGRIDWWETLDFIERYRVTSVDFKETTVPDDHLHALLSLDLDLLYTRSKPPIRKLKGVRINNLSFFGDPYSLEDIIELIELWLSNRVEIVDWNFPCFFTTDRLEDYFKTRFAFVPSGHEGDLPAARPLAISTGWSYRLLTEENQKMLSVHHNERGEDDDDEEEDDGGDDVNLWICGAPEMQSFLNRYN